MIVIFGGTTEGRAAAAAIDREGKPFYYSTLTPTSPTGCANAIEINGGMDADSMTGFIRDNGVRLIVDAAHPFAGTLHRTIREAADRCGVATVRYERTFPSLPPEAILCTDFTDAVRKLCKRSPRHLLALTGVNTIPLLKDYWTEHDCTFRILDREISRRAAAKAGFPPEKLVFYTGADEDIALVRSLRPDAIITKESGESGGFESKVMAAAEIGADLYVVCRPPLPRYDAIVTGPFGLRRAVERLLPGFYSLRSGFTTGSCAAAAAKAAALTLVGKPTEGVVSFHLPDGEVMEMDVSDTSTDGTTATATVVKDAGDDPDVINGHRVVATVCLDPTHSDIRIDGGEGIGRVTLPGLGLPVGDAAINRVPRSMIASEVREVIAEGGVNVIISIPGGEELAARTFNPKVGVEGGLSVIGTSGIVMPFSHEAFVESIRREISVALASGCNRIVINSGASSLKALRKRFDGLPPQAFIHYGNAVEETLRALSDAEVGNVTMGMMVGKAVKVAEGHFNTHSHNVEINRGFIRELAAEAGCSTQSLLRLDELKLAREIWTLPNTDDLRRFCHHLAAVCAQQCGSVCPGVCLQVMIISPSGEIASEACTDDKRD